jgi:hypothetical protein
MCSLLLYGVGNKIDVAATDGMTLIKKGIYAVFGLKSYLPSHGGTMGP